MQDEDDWVGTPPEGRYGRERADPAFWDSNRWPLAGAGIALAVVILLAVLLLR